MSICHRNGLGFLPRLIFRILKSLKFPSPRLNRLQSRVFGDDPRIIPMKIEQWALITELGNEDSTHEHIKKLKTLHVFVDSGASLPSCLSSSVLSHVKFEIYAFSDQSKAIAILGLKNRTGYKSLRDRYNEFSQEGRKMFEDCRDLAAHVVDLLVQSPIGNILASSASLREVIGLRLDDRMSSRLSHMACIKTAMEQVPEEDGILYIPANAGDIEMTRPYLEPAWHSKTCFVAIANETAPIKNDIDIGAAFAKLTSGFEAISKAALHLTKNIKTSLNEAPGVLLLHSDVTQDYKLATEALAIEAARRREMNEAVPVLIYCAGREDRTIIPELARSTGNNDHVAASFTVFSPAVSQNLLTRSESNNIVQGLSKGITEVIMFQGTDVTSVAMNTLAKFLDEALLWSVAGYHFGMQASQSLNLEGCLAVSSGHWLVRSVCAGVRDAANPKILVIDVQTLNILEHPKYRRPLADHMTVIDGRTQAIYASYFGVPKKSISVVGAPQNDKLQQEVKARGKFAIRKRLGINTGKTVIVLISQLQPLERMRRIIEPLGELLRDNQNFELVIRMHRRETHERQQYYADILKAFIPVNSIRFSVEDSAIDVLAVADLCVTIYSNMAREAAIVGIPVITVNYLDWEPPLRLDLEGLARPSMNPMALKANILNAVENKTKPILNDYLKANPHILRGDAACQIFTALDGLRRNCGKSNVFGNFKSLNVIMTSDNIVADLPSIFKNGGDLRVFNINPGEGRGFLPPQAGIEDGAFNQKRLKKFSGAIKRGNKWTSLTLDTSLDGLANWPEIHDILALHSYPLWLRMRPDFILSERELSLWREGLQAESEGLIICAEKPAIITYLIQQALEYNRELDDIFIVQMQSNLRHSVLSAADYLAIPSLPIKYKSRDITEASLTKLRADMSSWLTAIKAVTFDLPPGPRILLTTDWSLKTVPPTVLPILTRLKSKNTAITFAAINAAGKPDITSKALANTAFAGQDSLTPHHLAKTAPKLPLQSQKLLTDFWYNALITHKGFLEASPEIQAQMLASIDELAREGLPESLIWEQYCKQWFEGVSSVSIACPGRQWHTYIAHDIAEQHKQNSLTLQNAYMMAGYTYTKPTGRYITAIDSWSKSIFFNNYKVLKRNIEVTSSPRFDYLADVASMDTQISRQKLGLNSTDYVVVFAAQIGLETDTRAIMRILAAMKPVNGRKRVGLVKLHPRTSQHAVSRYLNLAASLNDDANTLKVTQDGDIKDFLAASDVVVTVYSNVGIEAAIAGKDLIIAKFDPEPLPLPLDTFDIGYVATSPDRLSKAIYKFATSETFAMTYRNLQGKFRQENPVMMQGVSADIIAAKINNWLH